MGSRNRIGSYICGGRPRHRHVRKGRLVRHRGRRASAGTAAGIHPSACPDPSTDGTSSEEPVVESRYVLYDIQLSEELQHYTQDVCEEYGVSYPLVIAIMKKESGFLPDAVSATNDYGIMTD